MEMELTEASAPRSKAITVLGVVIGTGGVFGLLSGLWLPSGTLATKWWGLPVSAGIVVLSVVELAFAYGMWKLRPRTLHPALRAIGSAVAIALILLGIYVSLSIGVRVPVGKLT
jgi:hypothetical protein